MEFVIRVLIGLLIMGPVIKILFSAFNSPITWLMAEVCGVLVTLGAWVIVIFLEEG